MTSVTAAQITQQKYPPQAQFSHEIVPSQAAAFQQMAASTAKQTNVVDLQALSSGAALSAGATSKNASSKHSASNLRAMNSHFGGVAMNNSENGEYT